MRSQVETPSASWTRPFKVYPLVPLKMVTLSHVPLANRRPLRYIVAVIPLILLVSPVFPMVTNTLPFADLKLVGTADVIL